MTVVKYNPLRELRGMQEQMNRLLNFPWNQGLAGEDLKEGIWQPDVDIFETEDAIVIKADVPDVDKKDIEVRVEGNTLLLKGERRQKVDVKKESYLRIERYFGSFQRSFSLPDNVMLDNVSALYERGVLAITLPKKDEIASKQIINVEVR